jgi:hypothetical protein
MDKKNRPICPQCKEPTIVLFTPPKKGIVGTWFGYANIGKPSYIDWKRAHLYCCNGSTNCIYTAKLMGDTPLNT